MKIFGYEFIVRKAGAAVTQERHLFDVNRVAMNPGDKIVLTTPYYVSGEVLDSLGRQWEKFCPETKALVLPEGMKMSVVGPSDAVVH